jgi:hypothetical protein
MDELIKSLESISSLMGSSLFSVGDIEDELLECGTINKYEDELEVDLDKVIKYLKMINDLGLCSCCEHEFNGQFYKPNIDGVLTK